MLKDLEKITLKNKRLWESDQPEPERGGAASIITMLDKFPATIILVQPRRMLIRMDRVEQTKNAYVIVPDQKGTIYGFTRRLNSKKWNYSRPDREDHNAIHVLIGQRLYEVHTA